MKRKVIAATVLVAMTIGGGAAALAGHGPGCDGTRQGAECDCGPRHQGAEMGPGGFYARMAKVLKLTDAQKSRIKEITAAEREQAKPFLDKMHESRKSLMQACEATTFDEAGVRTIAAGIGQVETELTVIRIRTQNRISALLTAEQRELAKSLRPDMERHMPPPPMDEGQ